CGAIRAWERPGALIGVPSALRAAGLFALGSGPARSLEYPLRCALRGYSRLGAARRAHWSTLCAARCGAIRAWERPGALIGVPSALRAAGLFALGSGPARSLEYPLRCALRGYSRLGAARRAHWSTLCAAR